MPISFPVTFSSNTDKSSVDETAVCCRCFSLFIMYVCIYFCMSRNSIWLNYCYWYSQEFLCWLHQSSFVFAWCCFCISLHHIFWSEDSADFCDSYLFPFAGSILSKKFRIASLFIRHFSSELSRVVILERLFINVFCTKLGFPAQQSHRRKKMPISFPVTFSNNTDESSVDETAVCCRWLS